MFVSLERCVPQLRKPHRRFRCRDMFYTPIGRVLLPLATPPGISTLFVELNIVRANIPELLGLDKLCRKSFMGSTVANRLTKRGVALKSGNAYVEMDFSTSAMFKRALLAKLHKQFVLRLKAVQPIKKTIPEETSSELLEVLQELSKSCASYQEIHTFYTRFRVSLGCKHFLFNDRIFFEHSHHP